jgi:hypothetical protein
MVSAQCTSGFGEAHCASANSVWASYSATSAACALARPCVCIAQRSAAQRNSTHLWSMRGVGSLASGRVRGLRGHRWLLMAMETKILQHDLVSGEVREIPRALWDNKNPTCLALLYASSARLLGFAAGVHANDVILGPVLAVGSTSGTVTLINLTTQQVMCSVDRSPFSSVPLPLPNGTGSRPLAGAWWQCERQGVPVGARRGQSVTRSLGGALRRHPQGTGLRFLGSAAQQRRVATGS